MAAGDVHEGHLELAWGQKGLELSALGPQPFATKRAMRVALRQDREGRAFARELGARVVSNDRFRDRMPEFKDLSRRFIRYMIVEGEVVFEQRNGRRKR